MPVKRIKKIFTLLISLLLVSCSNTAIIESWVEEDNPKSYKHPMIIGLSDSQQTRQIYEKHLVSELGKENIAATPGYTLISSKQKINRQTVINAIQGTEVDSVLVTYLVSADSEMQHRDSPINMGYSGNIANSLMSDTLISNQGRSRSTDIIGLKSDFYDVQSKIVVWSVQTQTIGPDSIDEVIINVTKLLINQLLDDDVLK